MLHPHKFHRIARAVTDLIFPAHKKAVLVGAAILPHVDQHSTLGARAECTRLSGTRRGRRRRASHYRDLRGVTLGSVRYLRGCLSAPPPSLRIDLVMLRHSPPRASA